MIDAIDKHLSDEMEFKKQGVRQEKVKNSPEFFQVPFQENLIWKEFLMKGIECMNLNSLSLDF